MFDSMVKHKLNNLLDFSGGALLIAVAKDRRSNENVSYMGRPTGARKCHKPVAVNVVIRKRNESFVTASIVPI